MKLASPAYTAVMLCGLPPMVSVEAANVAVQVAAQDSVPVPRVAAPSLNVTVPDGLPKAGAAAATVAVRTTDPNTAGLPEVATAVVELPLLTVTAFASVKRLLGLFPQAALRHARKYALYVPGTVGALVEKVSVNVPTAA